MATTRKNSGTDTAADPTSAPAETEAVETADTDTDTSTDDAPEPVDPAPLSTAVEPSAEGMMSEADAPAQSAAAEENHGNRVPIKLANPIEHDEHQRRLRLEVKKGGYNTGEIVWVTPDDARAIITAGLAQVDPEDREATLAAIRGQHPGMRS